MSDFSGDDHNEFVVAYAAVAISGALVGALVASLIWWWAT